MNAKSWLVITSVFLASCASAPCVQVTSATPQIPPLDSEVERAAQQPSFTERMRKLLSGSLETPTTYELRSIPASKPTIKLGTN